MTVPGPSASGPGPYSIVGLSIGRLQEAAQLPLHLQQSSQVLLESWIAVTRLAQEGVAFVGIGNGQHSVEDLAFLHGSTNPVR